MRFDVFATRMLYVVVFFVASLSTVQGDLWWLLRAGKDIWHTHQVSLVDQYSYTARGDYWPNHEWLWEVVAYLLHRIGGMPLLTACTAATITATVVVLRRVSPATGYIAPIVVGAALPLMSMSWTARPQATSTLLFAITMLLLVRGRELWLPPLFLLWANLHAQVVLGGILLGTVWVASLVEASRARTGESRHRAMRLTMVMVVAAAATLVTPLGFRLWSYVLGAIGRPGQHRIAEWESAFHLYISNVMFWITLILIVVLAVARPPRLATWERRVSLYAVLATAPLAMFAVRNIPVFAAAAVPVCMTLLEFHTRKPIGEVLRAREALVVASAVSFALVGLIWAAAPPRLGWNPMPPALVRALEACPGPLYNNYNAGATLIWWVPDVKVFVDNRQDPYPAEVIDAGLDHEAETYRRVFARWHVRCALVLPGTPLSTALRHDGWRRTFYDGASEVWVDGSPPRAINASE
jgi:hypothetical protein